VKKLSLLVAIIVIAASSAVHGQQPNPPIAQSVSPQTTDNHDRYLLEIYVLPNIGPDYLLVGGPKQKAGSAFYPRFIRIGPEPNSPRLPISQIKVEPQFDGKVAEVKVTLIRAEGADWEEQLLHIYQLSPGEQKTLTHMREFGIEPFQIKLVNADSPLPPEPNVQNFINAIEVVRVRRENKPMPAYRITVRNVSEKGVFAFKVDVTSDGQEGPSTLPDSDEGRPLMEPGKEIELYIPVAVSVRNGTDYVPGTAASHTINVRSVVFGDLSFEGEPDQACKFHAQVIGERLWLKGILPVLDQEIAKPDSNDQIAAAKQFKERVSALRHTLDETERNESSPVSSSCPKPATYATSLARQQNLFFLRDVDTFIAGNPASFKSWLEERRKRYAGWLARLWCPC
jgi:hypothetical protein